MRAFVRLQAEDGQTWALGPGDIIGRLAGAALRLDDARISEVHAMVSLRGRELKLLALRGLFAIAGQPREEVVLQPGLKLELARGVELLVCEVVLPELVLAVEGDGLPRQVLSGSMSLRVMHGAGPALAPRYLGDAEAHIWDNGECFRLRLGDGPIRDLRPDEEFTVAGRRFRAVGVTLDRAGLSPTHLEGAVHPKLHIVARFDTVHIHVAGKLVVALDGIAARIVSELVALGGPVAWDVVAGQIWRGEEDRLQLRRRWDINLARLRRKLRESHVRADLIRAGGTGQVELLLYTGDVAEDCT